MPLRMPPLDPQSPRFHLESLPFEIGTYEVWPAALPKSLPFTLTQDPVNGLIHQIISDELREALREYYLLGGYASTPLGEGEYGKAQGDYMLRALYYVLERHNVPVSTSRFLEIGASYGYLLHALKQQGAQEVLGVEPGKEGVVGSEKYGIPMVDDFFPTPKLDGQRFDVVFSHCMFEHVEDPLRMLREMYQVTAADGMVFFAVPYCSPKMSIGDISIICHQHVNYFTRESAENLLKAAGFVQVGTMISQKRAILFGWGIRPSEDNNQPDEGRAGQASSDELFVQFIKNYKKGVDAIRQVVTRAEQEGKTVGLYAPDSGLAGLLDYAEPPRIFNIDTMKHGKFMTGAHSAIESPDQLVEEPVDVLLVAPVDYDREIHKDLRMRGIPSATILVSLKELYERESGIPYLIGSESDGKEFIL